MDVELDNLYVKHAVANEGPRMKRIRPAPMGRAYRYLRRIAHIEIVLAERNKNGDPVVHTAGEETAKRGSVRAEAKAKAKRPRRRRRGKKATAKK